MANELIRVVTTIRVKDVGPDADFEQVANDVGEYLVGTAVHNGGMSPYDDQFMAKTHVHVSTDSKNCDQCIEHAMDEMS